MASNYSGAVSKKAAIIGPNGYTGLQMARLIIQHPVIELEACFLRQKDWDLSQFLGEGQASQVQHLDVEELKSKAQNFDILFFATPADASISMISELKEDYQGLIVDLSGAFRIDSQSFSNFYKFEHQAAELLSLAHYGLQPFSGAKPATQDSTFSLISNPGCYASSILMALLPLMKANLIESENIVIDTKSGTTGAGKKPKEGLLFSEVDEQCSPYKVGEHQHIPEVKTYLKQFGGVDSDFMMTTHLIPIRRGISTAIYCRTTTELTSSKILGAYMNSYEAYPFVKVEELKSDPYFSLALKQVVGSPRTHIGFKLMGQKLYVFSTIDNLMKGAASQAIENVNLHFDWPIEQGLFNQEGLI